MRRFHDYNGRHGRVHVANRTHLYVGHSVIWNGQETIGLIRTPVARFRVLDAVPSIPLNDDVIAGDALGGSRLRSSSPHRRYMNGGSFAKKEELNEIEEAYRGAG
jgi:hypothetical protein